MKNIINPDLYHGSKKSKNFFEGWYFKIVDKNNTYKFAFIPGISYGNYPCHHHSFIQIVNGRDTTYDYERFTEKSFRVNNDNFKISIDSNTFSLDGMNLHLRYKNRYIIGDLKFKNIAKWPDTTINPGSMGFYNYLSFMECYSQVCILDGDIIGSLNIDGTLVDFTGGKVYVEKNWGKSFPKSWLWIQSNSFEAKKVSVTCSLATIPFPVKSFRGFLIGVSIGNKFYRFTTMNKSKLKLNGIGEDIELIVTKKNLRLTLKTSTNKDDFVLCMGPKDGHMIPMVRETLNGRVYMLLEDTKTNSIIFEGTGKSTGVEYGGEMINIFD